MSQMILLCCIDQDKKALSDRIAYVDKTEKISLLKHDGVTLLANNVVLFERTKGYGLRSIVCKSSFGKKAFSRRSSGSRIRLIGRRVSQRS